LPVKQAL